MDDATAELPRDMRTCRYMVQATTRVTLLEGLEALGLIEAMLGTTPAVTTIRAALLAKCAIN